MNRLLFLIFIFISSSVSSQEIEYKFRNLSTSNGLSSLSRFKSQFAGKRSPKKTADGSLVPQTDILSKTSIADRSSIQFDDSSGACKPNKKRK